MKKKLIIFVSIGGALLFIIAVILGVLFVPRSIKTSLGINLEDIEEIYIEAGFDEKKQYFISENEIESFYKKMNDIHIIPTYSHTKSQSSILFVIQTEKSRFSFCEYYSITGTNSRKEFNVLDKEDFEQLYTFFADFNWEDYRKLIQI